MKYEKVLTKVFQEVERKREELVHTASELVKIPSLIGEETEAQRYIESRYRETGLRVESFHADPDEIKRHPAYIDIPHSYENRPNIVGVLEGSGQSRSLILNGHVDVVSPEPVDKWRFNPWGGEVSDGKIYGRGALDMKGGVIANLFAVRAIIDSGVKPSGKIICESVIEEEAGGSGGTLACFLRGYKADGMLISEPSNMNLVVSHNGV